MCLFVTRTPSSPLTDPALDELDSLVELFQEAVETCEAANDLLVSDKQLDHSLETRRN